MRIETPEQWAKRVAREIRAGQLTPAQAEEPVKDNASEVEGVRLAREIGREFAAKNASIADKVKTYLIGE